MEVFETSITEAILHCRDYLCIAKGFTRWRTKIIRRQGNAFCATIAPSSVFSDSHRESWRAPVYCSHSFLPPQETRTVSEQHDRRPRSGSTPEKPETAMKEIKMPKPFSLV
jgi:hypothetical protein